MFRVVPVGPLLLGLAMMVSGGEAISQSGLPRTSFTFCNEQPITLKVYSIHSVSTGASNGSIAGNLTPSNESFEGHGWRSLRPGQCFSVSSANGLTVALSLHYDFGDFLEPIRVGESDNDRDAENPIGYWPIETEYCVLEFGVTATTVVQRNDLNGFRPINGRCTSERLAIYPFTLQASVPRGGNYDLSY